MFRLKHILLSLLAAGLLALSALSSHGQSQMNLPLIDPLFQSTWENPAVRPLHRYSLGLPVLSSVELGLINNGFNIHQVSVEKDGKLVLQADKISDQVSWYKSSKLYSEMEIDLLHFRFNIYDWFIWFGARNVTRQSFYYDRDLFQFLAHGNQQGVLKQEGVQFNNLGLDLSNYTELSVGFSKMAEQWTFGARVSFLGGVANIHTENKGLKLMQSLDAADLYAITTEGSVALRSAGVDVDPKTHEINFDDPFNERFLKRKSWFGLKNPGAAIALGGSFSPIKGLNIALSASDLGMIYWSEMLSNYSVKQGELGTKFNGLKGIKEYLTNGKLSFKDYSVSSFFVKDEEASSNPQPYITWLSPKFHLMLTYDVARQTRLGLNISGIYDMRIFYPSATLMVQQSVSSWFLAQLSVSYNQRSFLNVGAGLVLSPRPFQFYIVTDNLLGLISPTRLNATNIRVGVNFVWGTLRGNTKLPHRYASLSIASSRQEVAPQVDEQQASAAAQNENVGGNNNE